MRVFRLAGTIVSLAALLAVAGLAAAGRTGAASQDASARERAMYVSVVDRQGAPVTGLPARDFVVREDGVVREVLMAEAADDPITIALLVDNSTFASPVIPDVRRALTAFAQKIGGGQNPIAVTTFADRPTILQDYTLVVPQVVRGVERIFPAPGSGSYLLQALVDIAKGFGKRDFDRGVIVVITTEGPEFSELNQEQVLPALRQSGASVEAFVFTAMRAADTSSISYRQRAAVLDRGPRETGGRHDDLLSSMGIDDAMRKLADRLTHEYRITYSRPESLIPPEKIEVSVKRPGLDAVGTPVRVKPRG